MEDPASTAPLPDLDDREDSITTASPVVAGISPLTPDSTESLEETEVKTLTAVSPVQPAAGKPLGPAPRPVVPETKAPALAPQVAAASAAPIPITAVPSTASPVSPRLSMPGSSVPTPKPSPSPFTGSDADDDGVITEARGDLRAKQAPTPPIPESDPDDESVTTRASAFSDDSVTHEAPVVTKDGPPKDGPSLRADGVPIVHEDDSNDAVTMLNPRSPSAPSSPALPAEEEGESITTQAPGHLTNMLRVIAAETPASGARAVDASLQNETAVMVGAPVKNPASEARQPGAGPAQGGEVLSDSALRLERPDGPGTDRGSLGSLRAAGAQPRTANDLALARTEPLFGQSPASGSFHEVPATKSPRYGLLVGVVAAISILVPVVLFVVLKSNAEAPPRGSPAQPISDMVRRTDPLRAKAPRNVPSSSPASSSKPGPARWPFHRR